MQVINPVALVTGLGSPFTPMIARVTHRETITLPNGGTAECLVVEAPGVRAWIDNHGLAVKQQVNLPMGGQITVTTEDYDRTACIRARSKFRGRPIAVRPFHYQGTQTP